MVDEKTIGFFDFYSKKNTMKNTTLLIFISLFGVNVQAQSWSEQFSQAYSFYDLAFNSNMNGWAVGFYNSIVHTNDGGVNWTMQTSATPGQLEAVYASPSNINTAIVGGSDLIMTTTDGGTNWTNSGVTTSRTFYNIKDIDMISGTEGIAAGNGSGQISLVFATTDSGATWSELSANVPANAMGNSMNAVLMRSASTFLLGGGSGSIVRATNFGANMTEITSGTLNEMDQFGMHVWAVGHNGTILRSTDSGQTWASVANPFGTNHLLDVQVISETEIYVTGKMGIGKTTDGGLTWTLETIVGWTPSLWVYCISVKDNNSAWAIASGKVFSLSASSAGLDESQLTTFSISPNPTTNYLNIEVTEPSTIQLVSLNGEVLNEWSIQNSQQVDVSDYASGMYMLLSTLSNETKRLVIQ